MQVVKVNNKGDFKFPTSTTTDNVVNHTFAGTYPASTTIGTWENQAGSATYATKEFGPVQLSQKQYDEATHSYSDEQAKVSSLTVDDPTTPKELEYNENTMYLLPQTITPWNPSAAGKPANGTGAYFLVKTKIWNVAEGKGTNVTLNVKNVHLWDGVADPYLYTVKAELTVDGKVTDAVSTTCGVRYFSFNPDKGFFLNGRPYNLHGVSRHQDFKGIGNAITKEHHDKDMELIREIGANTIRLAHYQHDQYFYDLCDKYGMVVWAEIPYISEHLANGNDNTISQMKELIIQNYNHPCIVTWGLSNEITISGRSKKKQMLENHRVLQKMVKEMDPTRVTTLACYAMCIHWNKVAHISDIVAWNLYLGWYVPGFFLNDWWIKLWRMLYPKRCLGFSEYGAEGMPNLHAAKPKRGDNTEEYQNKYHEFMLECFKRHPYMWGNYVWNMFDFAADARNQGGEPGMNHKGLVTFDRKLKKDCFYLYKAYWTEAPFVYLAGRRYEYRTEAVTDITVYSTCKEVSLYNNGKLVETKKGEHVFKFKLPMEATNNLEVKAGDCVDSAVIYKTDKPRPEYSAAKVDSSNWM